MIVIDEAIYPRAAIDSDTVARYVGMLESGSPAPAVIVEKGTGRLLDGRHRYEAHVKLDRLHELQVEERDVPEGSTALLLAASLAARNGLPLAASDARSLARQMYEAAGDASVAAVAKALLVPRKTVEGWLSAQIEERREIEASDRRVRKLLAVMLRRAGWTQTKIAEHLGISQGEVSKSIHSGDVAGMNEPDVWAAVAAAPEGVDLDTIAKDILVEAIFSTWTQPERDLLARHRAGETIVVNMRADAHSRLWEWAVSVGVGERIDRRTDWGNPFVMGEDGDRETVIANYRDHFLPFKPSLDPARLRGSALGCWCSPLPCHGDILLERIANV